MEADDLFLAPEPNNHQEELELGTKLLHFAVCLVAIFYLSMPFFDVILPLVLFGLGKASVIKKVLMHQTVQLEKV